MILALAITEFWAQIELLRLVYRFLFNSILAYLLDSNWTLHQNPQIFFGQCERCAEYRMRKNYDIIIVVLYLNITNFEIIKALRVTSKGEIHLLQFNFPSVCNNTATQTRTHFLGY